MRSRKVAGANAWRRTRRCARRAAARRARPRVARSVAAAWNGGHRVPGGEDRGHAQGLVVVGRCAGRPGFLGAVLLHPGASGGLRQRGDAPGIETRQPVQELPDRGPVRAIAWLADGRVPATGQPLAGSIPERLGQQLVEEPPQDEFGAVALDGVANPWSGARRWIESGANRRLHRFEGRQLLIGQELGDRRAERDRGRRGACQSIHLIRAEGRDPLEELRQRLGRVDPPMADRPSPAADIAVVVPVGPHRPPSPCPGPTIEVLARGRRGRAGPDRSTSHGQR